MGVTPGSVSDTCLDVYELTAIIADRLKMPRYRPPNTRFAACMGRYVPCAVTTNRGTDTAARAYGSAAAWTRSQSCVSIAIRGADARRRRLLARGDGVTEGNARKYPSTGRSVATGASIDVIKVICTPKAFSAATRSRV